MKRIGKYVLRVVALALALILAFTAYPYVRGFVLELLGDIDYDRSARVITHEMEKLGELTTLRLSDTGVMDASVDALLIGKVASVSVEYQYNIGFGVDLTAAHVTSGVEGITIALPKAKMLYDSFEVTGKPSIDDVFSQVSEMTYQKMLSDQALACRETYINDPAVLDQAWDAACEALKALLGQWANDSIDYTFRQITE